MLLCSQITKAKEKLKHFDCAYIGWKEKDEKNYIYYYCDRHKEYGLRFLTYERIINAKSKNSLCPHCQANSKSLSEIENNPEVSKDVTLVWKSIQSDDKKILVECKHCGNRWMISPLKLMQGRRCPECRRKNTGDRYRYSHEKLDEVLHNRNPYYDFVEYPEHTVKGKAKFICNLHDVEWVSSCETVLYGTTGCPICGASTGEREIGLYLVEHKIKSKKKEQSFDGCEDRGKLRFDFYLPKYNICIEYQGEQHYEAIRFSGTDDEKAKERFERLKRRDEIKRNFCKENGITLVEIPYYEIDKHNVEPYLDNLFTTLNIPH